MHIRVDVRDGPGSVRLLKELPAFPVGLLQGYNGIGKTLTVRLLEVLTGTMPYPPDEPAWTSMCRAVGSGNVTISGLQDLGELSWAFDSTKWEQAGLVVRDDWFESIMLDGQPTTLARIRQALRVHRLAGDETLLDSLAGMVDGHRGQFSRLVSDLTAERGQLTAADKALDEAVLVLSRLQLDRFRSDLHNVNAGITRLKELGAAHDAATAKLSSLEKAAETIRSLEMFRLRRPALTREIERLDGEIQKLETEKSSLDAQLKVQTQRAAVSDKVRQDLDNARRTRDRNRSKLEAASSRLSVALAALSLEPDADVIDVRIDDARRRIADLERRKEEADAVPQLRTALDDVVAPLERAQVRGLGDHELLDLDERPVTVRELATAAKQRRRDLEGRPPAPEVLALDESLQREKRHLAALVELPELLEDVNRFRRLFEQQEDRLKALLATGALEATKRMQQLEQRRAQADHELLRLSSARAAAAQQRADVGQGFTPEQLMQDLEGHLRAAETTAEELAAALKLESGHVAALTAERVELTRTTEASRSDLQRQRAELRSVVLRLREDDLTWLRTSPIPESEDELLAWLGDHTARAAELRDRLGKLRSTLQGVLQSLDSIAAQMRGQASLRTNYESVLSRWLSGKFSQHFNQPMMKQYLFPGAADVHVDLSAKHVTWAVGEQSFSRPLTAFSSGEQAFAYTQARLAALDVRDAADLNRLIVLDEFGSFIAEDRLHDLYKLLLARHHEHPRDQILIILPLRDDFASQAANALGRQRDVLMGLAQQLEQQAFAIQDLTT